MKSNLLLSIIIPVYNAENNIEKLVRSFNGTKYKISMEIICIDDGSNDNSWEILQRLEKEIPYLKTYHQDNAGVSHARNEGIKKAVGLYLFFVDADDAIRTDKFDSVVKEIYKHDDDLAIFGIEDHFLYKDNKIEVKKNYAINKLYNETSFFLDFGFILNKHIMYSPCNKIYKNSIIKENNISFNTNYAIGEDILFNIDYFYHVKKVEMFSAYVYIYYHDMEHAISGSSRYHTNEWEILLYTFDEIKKLLSSKNVYKENEKWFHTFVIRKLSYSLNMEYGKNSPLSKEEKKGFINEIYRNLTVQEALQDKRVKMEEKDQKLLHFLHKKRAVSCIHTLYTIRNR